MLPVMTGQRYFRVTLAEFVATKMRERADRKGVRLPSMTEVHDGPPVVPHINHNHWQIRCECGGAEFAWDEGLMMCQTCWNGKQGGKWRRVAFPAERQQIERIMQARPFPQNRHWTTETITELKAENRENGDPEEV